MISSVIRSSEPRVDAVLLEGEAGMGKTTLWETALTRFRGEGLTVLAARAAQSEVRLSFAVLGDLLEPLQGSAALTTRHQHALDIALGKSDAPSGQVDARSLGLAVLALLRSAGSEDRLLLAIDDVQWVDTSSRRVLEFVFRRLSENCRVLLTMRTEAEPSRSAPLRDIFEPDRLTAVRLPPLSVADLTNIVADRLDARPGRTTIERLHRLSGGNPLYALELARAAGPDLAELDVAQPRLPSTLQQAIAARLKRLESGARQAALIVSALSHPQRANVRAVLAETDASDDSVERAVEAGVLTVEGTRLRLAHPLFGAVLHASMPLRKRLELHQLLARFARNDEERARHLALATIDSDPEVATSLDSAASSAYARGAPDAAAELADRARRLTPPDDVEAFVRRSVDTAAYFLEAGNVRAGEKLLEDALAVAPAGTDRARCLQLLARFRFFSGDLPESRRLYEEAVSTPDLASRASAHEGLGNVTWLWGEGRSSVDHALRAAEGFATVGDRVGVAEALAEAAYVETLLGEGVPEDRFAEAIAMEDHDSHVRILRRPSFWVTMPYLWVDDIAAQADALHALARRAIDEADELSTPMALQAAVEAESRLGRIAEARRDAAAAEEAAAPAGRDLALDALAGAVSLVASITGDVEQARRMAREGIAFSERTHSLVSELRHRSVLALTELSVGDHEAAVDAALPLVERVEKAGYVEPWVQRFVPDLVEALLALGRTHEAIAILTQYEKRALRLGRVTASAAAYRCHALVLMDQGEFERAGELLRSALELHERCGDRFASARTLLVAGVLQRRAKRRGEARRTLQEAERLFSEMQAQRWVEKVQMELKRIGGRASSPVALTPTEMRVAELVGRGLTNREIAGQLFLTPKTVEANLTRIYRKSGVASRAELRRRLPSLFPRREQT